MRRKAPKILVTSILAMLILTILPTTPALASPTSTIFFDPSSFIYDTGNATIGTTFTFTINVTDVSDMAAFEVKFYYDISMINITWIAPNGWIEPTTNPDYVFAGVGTMPVPAVFTQLNPHNASISFACSMFPAPAPGGGFYGDGKLAELNFTVLALPGKLEVWNTSLGWDETATFYVDSAAAVHYYDVYTDGYYEITWLEPPKPDLAVRGPAGATELTFGPFPPAAICTEFWVGAYVENLDAAWGLTGANFCLCFDNALINVTAASSGPLWTTSSITPLPITDGKVCANLSDPSATPSGTVLLLNVTFHIIYQNTIPPATFGDYNDTYIDFCEYTLIDPPSATVPVSTVTPCHIIIYALSTIPMPWLEVVDPTDGDHDVVLGPEPSIGKEFEVDVVIKNLHPSAHMVGYQFRLTYCGYPVHEYLKNISITEGPFLTDPRWNKFGTVFVGRFDPPMIKYPECAVVAGILWPDPMTGDWTVPPMDAFPTAEGPDVNSTALGVANATHPPADPVLATIRFRAIKQVYPENLHCDLELWDYCEGFYFIDKDGKRITNAPHVNGTYTMRGDYLPGREIDVYTQYPDGFNGKGPDVPSDMFWPQKQVILYAKVTYNYWPVQQKIVSFEIQQPCGDIVAKLTAITDEDGIAVVTYRIPWPCDHEEKEKLFGKWLITATVDIACEIVNDTLQFDFDYRVRIDAVTTEGGVQDEGEWFNHCQWVTIRIRIKTKLQRNMWILICVVIKDALDVPIGIRCRWLKIGGAKFCTYKYYEFTLAIHIPKHAFVGWATLHVNCFDKNPTEGGHALCPEYEPPPEIFIQPYGQN